MKASIYYDGLCPLCDRYVRHQRLAKLGEVHLLDLRAEPEARERLEKLGVAPDRGMAVESAGRFYVGADAMHWLALHTTASGVFNRVLAALFSKPLLGRALYPLLRAGRNTLLLFLGRPPLQSAEAGAEVFFCLFSALWGLFAGLHYLVYAFQFAQPIYLTTALTPLLGLLLLLKPGSRRLFVCLLLVMGVDAWLHMPVLSNHTMIKNVLVLAMLVSGIWHGLRGSPWADFVRDFAAVGRCALLVMYVFGVFHKINADFLNPEVSCAVTLWREMPLLLRSLDNVLIHQLAIWGTLLIETVILVLLLVGRWRHLGILLGMAFHMLLAFSNYAMYAPFSMLSIVLHSLFISPRAAQAIISSSLWKRVYAALKTWKGLFVLLLWLGLVYGMAWLQAYSSVSIMWMFVAVPLWWMIARHGRPESSESLPGPLAVLRARPMALNLITLAFFFNCITPYLGLKTAQSINMFANLRLEAGVSNHLLLPWKPGPFSYLEDVVSIEAASGSQKLLYLHREGLHAVYYDLLDSLERNPGARVSYTRNGVYYGDQSAETLAEDIQLVLHPRWVRKWFHFMPVDLEQPKVCALDR